MAKTKKEFGEGVTALAPEDVVKAYDEAHPKRKGKKKTEPVASEVQKETEAEKPEIQLSDFEQLKKDVDAALSLLPRVKALLSQIVILPEDKPVQSENV